MSKQLDKILDATFEGNIKGQDEIREIMDGFLGLSVAELTGGQTKFEYIVRDLATGFGLLEEKVKELSIRELIILIGYEPGTKWFMMPKDDAWFYQDDKYNCNFFTAGTCFALGFLVMCMEKKIQLLGRFIKMDFRSFLKYLGIFMTEEGKNTEDPNLESELRRNGMRLNRFCHDTEAFVKENGSPKSGEEITVGDLLTTICSVGRRCWTCGVESLDSFASKVYMAYRFVQFLFMDCIRMILIERGRDGVTVILNKCCESGDYFDENPNVIDFDSNCYE